MKRIVDAATNGIMEAIGDHYRSSRNSHWYGEPREQRSPWHAPEYMFTVSIYREIIKLENPPYVDMEDPVEATIWDAGGWGGGRIPAAARREGWFDIVLSDEAHQPFAIIEVKMAAGPADVRSDAERICAVLNRPTPTIKWGMLALVIPGQDAEGNVGYLEGRIELFGNTVPTYVGDWNVSRSVRETEEVEIGRRYAAMVFKIGPRRSRA